MEGKIKSYKELIAYQKSYEVVKLVYKESRKFPKEEIYGLTSQLRRVAVSVPSNIAEGYMRGSKDYARFLQIALGSCAEVETQLSLSKDLGFLNNADYKTIQDLNTEVIKLITTYINKMRN